MTDFVVIGSTIVIADAQCPVPRGYPNSSGGSMTASPLTAVESLISLLLVEGDRTLLSASMT